VTLGALVEKNRSVRPSLF